ncbi:cytochrome P450 [Yinghuangia seranimata]|uniref:cytochrome P450 n=1 Tax=Yinghuangia seranimata TaxID=408067 RepID=UPI00248B48A0|nr:cytochrome P450 [Yinghuangia seranimata]MDI2125588.1 cytochrome P450 [Yinghuangia seranimata]
MTAQLPFAITEPLRPPPEQRRLRDSGDVHKIRTRVGDEAWLVTGYEHVRALLDDERLGRTHPAPETAPRSGESALLGTPLPGFETEKADHTRMRRLLQPYFSPRRMRALRARVEELTAELLDAMEKQGPTADLCAALALPLPILVICELLGVPYEDRERFRAWSVAVGDVADADRSLQGLAELYGYGLELVARKRREPGDDVISGMCATEGVSDAEIARMSMLLLFAGHETTVVQIGFGALLLLATPGQWASLVADPSRIDAVVEEVMRAPSVGNGGIPRWAKTDLEVAGTRIRAGELVMLDTFAANHDGTVYASPDLFDPERVAAPHVAFGYGARYCLGAPLARIELAVVFGQLARRFPGLRLAVPPAEVRFTENQLTSGVVALPVAW